MVKKVRVYVIEFDTPDTDGPAPELDDEASPVPARKNTWNANEWWRSITDYAVDLPFNDPWHFGDIHAQAEVGSGCAAAVVHVMTTYVPGDTWTEAQFLKVAEACGETHIDFENLGSLYIRKRYPGLEDDQIVKLNGAELTRTGKNLIRDSGSHGIWVVCGNSLADEFDTVDGCERLHRFDKHDVINIK